MLLWLEKTIYSFFLGHDQRIDIAQIEKFTPGFLPP